MNPNAHASPPALRQLQRWFASITTQPEGIAQGHDRSRKLERLVTAGPAQTAAERLQIYQHGYFARLVECLLDDYPALAHALGAERFESLCHAYIAQQPSRSPSLNRFGQGLPELCRARPEAWASFAAELAGLEWALVEIVHESQLAPLPAAALASAGERLAGARFLVSPTLRVLRCAYPVNAYYQAYRDETALEIPAAEPSALAVFRQGLTLWRQPLELRAALLLEDLQRGATLESAVTALATRAPSADLAARLPRWLGGFVESGFFHGLELE